MGYPRRRPLNEPENISARVHGDTEHTLIYLPGLHGDWTLVSSFRVALRGRVRFVEFTYPRRTDWSLEEYARAVAAELKARDITHGWLLAESFGSQVAWQMVEAGEFAIDGLILAGGFVRHPVIPGVHAFHLFHRSMPAWFFRFLLRVYAAYARLRHRQAPETLACIDEFLARRTEADRLAIGSRYPLIAAADFREVARRARLPVFALTGFFDPIVPWPLVHPWLRRHCPGFAGAKIIFRADHNVLATAPERAAAQVLEWMGRGAGPKRQN